MTAGTLIELQANFKALNLSSKMLRNFRAGIEAGISTLKRAFGLDRCTWSGWGGFKQYVWSSIVSCLLYTSDAADE